MNAPTGEQYALTRGSARAVITQVAAGLREFSVDGVDVTVPYAEGTTPPSASGIVLAPWPNRVADARWLLDGVVQQLDITEPAKGNAIHGLLRYAPYTLVERDASSVTLAAVVYPQHGYPFHVATTVRYELVDGGLDVTHTARTLSDAPAPVGFGTHPYLTIGDVPTDDLELTVHASTFFEVDARLIPTAELPVTADVDLRAGRRIGDVDLDTAYGTLATVDGASAALRAPDGREVRLLQDARHGYLQVYTPRDFPLGDGTRGTAVALEPMTCPPGAFNSGLGLEWLEPGRTFSVGWGIRASWA